MTKRILIITAMLASFAMLPTGSEAQQPPKPQPQAPKPQPPQQQPQPPQQGGGAQAAPAPEGAAPAQPVDEATRKRQAALEREKERQRQKLEREAQCVIKPVMTDAEIAKCREVRGG